MCSFQTLLLTCLLFLTTWVTLESPLASMDFFLHLWIRKSMCLCWGGGGQGVCTHMQICTYQGLLWSLNKYDTVDGSTSGSTGSSLSLLALSCYSHSTRGNPHPESRVHAGAGPRVCAPRSQGLSLSISLVDFQCDCCWLAHRQAVLHGLPSCQANASPRLPGKQSAWTI